MRVYISPSSQFGNKYACGDFNEAETCYQIAQACRDYLAQFVDTKMPSKADTTYQQRVEESNAWGADIHLCIHTNAGGGDGTVVFCHPKNTSDPVIASVYNEVSALSPGDDDGIRGMTNLYEINKTNAKCVYVECEFHDHPIFSKWILDNILKIGRAIAKGLLNGAGFADDKEADTAPLNAGYRVICGVFAVRENAINRYEELKKRGINAFVYTHRNMQRVQVGFFANLENAFKFKETLYTLGYDAFITQD